MLGRAEVLSEYNREVTPFQAHSYESWQASVPGHLGFSTGLPHGMAAGFPLRARRVPQMEVTFFCDLTSEVTSHRCCVQQRWVSKCSSHSGGKCDTDAPGPGARGPWGCPLLGVPGAVGHSGEESLYFAWSLFRFNSKTTSLDLVWGCGRGLHVGGVAAT